LIFCLQTIKRAGNVCGMNSIPSIGTRIEATRPADSFYSRVRGVVTGYRNGLVKINADEVISKWSKTWEKHPSTCSMNVKLSDLCA
jgi:hypothetical protein